MGARYAHLDTDGLHIPAVRMTDRFRLFPGGFLLSSSKPDWPVALQEGEERRWYFTHPFEKVCEIPSGPTCAK